MKINRGKIFMLSGVLLVIAALFLTLYNRNEDIRAETKSARMLAQLKEQIPEIKSEDEILSDNQFLTIPTEIQSQYTETNEIPEPDLFEEYEEETDSYAEETVYYSMEIPCIGIVSIPSLGLELPVIANWSYSDLRIAPCRYSGTIDEGNMIIAAHNYSSHFGRISELHTGDEIMYTDADGIQYRYTVVQSELINGKDTEAMKANSDEWDITLFTCTLSGASRVTVRAEKAE